MDFLLGEVKTGPAAIKSAQRGFDFTEKLKFNRSQLRNLLASQITDPDFPSQIFNIRENKFDGPLLNVRIRIRGSNDAGAHLISSWEVMDAHLRLVTAGTEIDKN